VFVLAIDTSSAAVAAGIVVVADGAGGRDVATGQVLAERREIAPRGHGEHLSPAIAACLADARLRPGDLGAVVSGVGPGPYTGLRVGLVTAASLAHALGVPTYGVCSLDAIALRDEGDAIVVTDARRREVYWARYDQRGGRVDGPHVARPADVPFDGVSNIAGAAVEMYEDLWPAHVARLPSRYPEPAALVALVADRIGGGAESEPLIPLYLRRPDAVEPGAPKSVSQR
jgi:tRNA threonylcarbamoyl adenosine modification protein YeaZ